MMTKADIARLIKETVANSTDADLDLFMSAYVCGTMAGWCVDQMIAPGQRAAWVQQIREKYPADFGPTGQS